MSRVTLEALHPGEIVKETFDFTSRLVAAETISSATSSISIYSGATDATLPQLYGAATISSQQVTQRVGGGDLGVIYYLLCRIVTSTGQTLQLGGFLPVLPLGA